MSEEADSHFFGYAFMAIMFLLLVYLIIGQTMEHYKISFLHETGVGILMGIILGLIISSISVTDSTVGCPNLLCEHLSFNQEYFFFYLLPPIIFSGGYNLQKRRFFKNFFYIVLYGLLSTLLNFGITVGLTIAIDELGMIKRWDHFNDQSIHFDLKYLMLFSATICATDSVAALAMIKPDKYPKLFSVLFGEGMVNDSVAIILFAAVQSIFKKDTGFNATVFFELVGQFLLVAFGSIAIGLALGLICTFMFRKLHYMTHSSAVENCLILFYGLLSYAICEILGLSGVISVLVVGIVLAHYNFYNISPTGQITTGVFLQTLALFSEAFIYIYLGISSFQERGEGEHFAWSWTFTLLELLITIIARVTSIVLPSVIFRLIKGKDKWILNRYEISILSFAGIIRGSVAFALINKIPLPVPEFKDIFECNFENSQSGGDPECIQLQQLQIIQSSVLFIVIITTIVLGAIMPFYINWNLNQIKINPRYGPDHPSIRDAFERDGQNKEQSDVEGSNLKERILEDSDEINIVPAPKPKKGFKKCDEEFFKPAFIYNYNERKSDILIIKAMMKMTSDKFDIEDPIQRRFLLNAKIELDKLSPQKMKEVFAESKRLTYLKMSTLDENRGHNTQKSLQDHHSIQDDNNEEEEENFDDLPNQNLRQTVISESRKSPNLSLHQQNRNTSNQ